LSGGKGNSVMNFLSDIRLKQFARDILTEYGAIKVNSIDIVCVNSEYSGGGEFTAYIDGKFLLKRMGDNDHRSWKLQRRVTINAPMDKTMAKYGLIGLRVTIGVSRASFSDKRRGLKMYVVYELTGAKNEA
jgi:hypothetical protein